MISKVKQIVVQERMAYLRALAPALCLLFLLTTAAAQKPAIVQGESRYTSLEGTRIHYQTYGKGREAIVLIHGWSCNLDNWRDQIPEFEKRKRVIAIDLPGHGQSGKPKLTYSMDLFARAVDAVMRDARVERGGFDGSGVTSRMHVQ